MQSNGSEAALLPQESVPLEHIFYKVLQQEKRGILTFNCPDFSMKLNTSHCPSAIALKWL